MENKEEPDLNIEIIPDNRTLSFCERAALLLLIGAIVVVTILCLSL